MKTPRFSDLEKHQRPYATVEESRKPGYLARKFARIRADQAAAEAEVKAKVKPLKKATA